MDSAVALISGADRQLAVAAQNVSNMTSPGYRAHHSFWSMIDPSLDGQTTPVVDFKTDFTPGKIRLTSNTYDLAIGGTGFFEVRSGDETRYTRNGQLSPLHLAKVETAKRSGKRTVGCVYKRTRPSGKTGKVQRAEIRFDNVSGCLRTPAGGSSRQLIVVVDGPVVRSRLITARETARLMGLPDSYVLPKNYNDAYHLTGDGVAVPVVRHLAANILEPIVGRGVTAPSQPQVEEQPA